MNYFLSFFVLCAAALRADPSSPQISVESESKPLNHTQPPPPPYDADLFRKNVQVYSLHGEFLFWRVQESALDYALVMNQQSWGPILNYAQGSMRCQTFNGDPGFRLAFSFFRASRMWEMKIAYTRLTATGSNHVNKPTPSTNYLTGTWPQIMSTLSSAKTHIHMNYNVGDWLFDRFFNPNPHLRLRLIGGGSVAWINQNWVIQYFDSSAHHTTIQNKWSYAGGGLKTGVMLDWFWGLRDLYMTLQGMCGGFVGEYYNCSKMQTTYPEVGANSATPFGNAAYKDVRGAITFQFLIGPSWQRSYAHSRIEFFAGYEANFWLNLHEVFRSSNGAPQDPKLTYINTSMITLQGLTFRSTVDF